MDNSFREFLDTYLRVWNSSSLIELRNLISKDYKGREITKGEIADFGMKEAVRGWEQGFNFVKENNAEWKLNVLSTIPLNADETMVIISATMIIQGKSLDTANLFFQTFKNNRSYGWKLIRSYIESGIPNDNINRMLINGSFSEKTQK
ncbi:flavoprotein [Niallia sp. Sow4_A1]|jgi:hypothetical protein|uniref:flavoprotein n=1 Tax=Bacillaceae TaxID=186817 RepID=UPI001F2B6AEB|nr:MULTISPECIES: flavoprotein [Bacillaceae]MCF2649195.1 flavoprotein [Niallia circulans]CAI9395142.1 hypothetical protein BACSP_00884 [Bacillus sp. T2.9-1]